MEILWKLSAIRTPVFDVVFQAITYLGEDLLPIAIICALYWCINKKLATQIGITFISSGMLVQGLKITFRIPRPWVLDSDFKPVESAVSAATGYSFPSGHTQAATSLFAPLALNTRNRILQGLFTFLFLSVGFSRMYLGCHTLKDVGTAIILTVLLAFLVWKFQDYLIEDTKHTTGICIVIFAFSVCLCIYSFIQNKLGLIDAHYVADCFKMAGAGAGFSLGWYLERTKLNFQIHAEETGRKKLVLRFLIGLLTTGLIYLLPKLLLPGTALWKFIRYAATIFWIIYGYPYFFTRYEK